MRNPVEDLYTTSMYLVYLVVSALVTLWVGKALHRGGRAFLANTFGGNQALTEAVNDLLVVGFYLFNAGYVALLLPFGKTADDVSTAIESFSTKIGVVLVLLGIMHFSNLLLFAILRRRKGQAAPDGPASPPRYPESPMGTVAVTDRPSREPAVPGGA